MKHVVEFFLTIPFHFREDAFQMRPQAQYVVRGLARDFPEYVILYFLSMICRSI